VSFAERTFSSRSRSAPSSKRIESANGTRSGLASSDDKEKRKEKKKSGGIREMGIEFREIEKFESTER